MAVMGEFGSHYRHKLSSSFGQGKCTFDSQSGNFKSG